MKRTLRVLSSLAIAYGVTWAGETPEKPPLVPASGIARNVLTNQGVALLAKAGYSEGFIIDIIHHKQTRFDVSAEGLAWLAKEGLSERIVRAMVVNENKEEQTAILPAAVQVMTSQTSLPENNVPLSQAAGRATPRPSAYSPSVNVSVPVRMPTSELSTPSWIVRGWEPSRWYLLPR